MGPILENRVSSCVFTENSTDQRRNAIFLAKFDTVRSCSVSLEWPFQNLKVSPLGKSGQMVHPKASLI
jgi:hypothetical protein